MRVEIWGREAGSRGPSAPIELDEPSDDLEGGENIHIVYVCVDNYIKMGRKRREGGRGGLVLELAKRWGEREEREGEEG